MQCKALFLLLASSLASTNSVAAAPVKKHLNRILQQFPADWPYLSHCLDPFGPGGLFQSDLTECSPDDQTSDFDRASRIAIVGAGPAGVSMAKLLHDKGFKNLTLFEKNDRVGGKSKTIEFDGVNYDVGTLWMAGKFECIELLADSVNISRVPLGGAALVSDENAVIANLTPPNFGDTNVWGADYAFQTYGVLPDKYQETLLSDVTKYIQEWTRTMGSVEYMFPDESSANFEDLNQSYLSWLEARNITALIPTLHLTTSSVGYGPLGSVPAIYGLMWNHPNLLSRPGARSTPLEGWQTLWERLLSTTSTDVYLSASITNIRRSSDFVEISFESADSPSTKQFDFLIMAAPMPAALDMFESPTAEETNLFSEYNYRVSRIDVGRLEEEESVLPESFNRFLWPGRMELQTDFHVASLSGQGDGSLSRIVTSRDGVNGPLSFGHYGRIKNSASDISIAYSIPPFDLSEAESRALLQNDIGEYGLAMDFVYAQVWTDYFPWKNLTDIVEEKIPWRIWDNQGNERTWFIGSYTSFESVADVVDYNIKLINERLCQTSESLPPSIAPDSAVQSDAPSSVPTSSSRGRHAREVLVSIVSVAFLGLAVLF